MVDTQKAGGIVETNRIRMHEWEYHDNYPHDYSCTYTCKVCGDERMAGVGWGSNLTYPCKGPNQNKIGEGETT